MTGLSRWRRACTLFTLLFLLAAGLSGPVLAQAGLSAADPPAATAAPELRAADPDALADLLADETRRNELIATLRALAAARDASMPQTAPAKASGDPGAAIIDGIMAQMRRAGSAFAAFGALFSDLPALGDWLRLQVEDPRRRMVWSDVLLKLGATLLVA
ncbi:hypothetical protein, partial [Ferrovibrio sp.]|uniref:hypothetical protein n=1 Tax=Ferrovibrio sp. TaxID=1917215 RepID=UPI002627B45A